MIETIYIKQTEITPLVSLDNKNCIIQIKGILIPENSSDFFKPIFNWLDEYAQKPDKKAKFEFELDYFNTLSSIMLLEMMRKIQKIPNQTMVWIIDPEDEDMLEVINDYNELLGGGLDISLKEEKYTI